MTSLWRHLWPNYDTLDFKILTQCVKMLGERVLQVWRWYLQRFRRYRKKTRGGGARNSPPSGARVKCKHDYFITDSLLDWLKSYLTDRRQKVRVGDTLLTSVTINAGCPQGSILGPLLALIYLDGLPDKLTNTALLYADDISLYASHQST